MYYLATWLKKPRLEFGLFPSSERINRCCFLFFCKLPLSLKGEIDLWERTCVAKFKIQRGPRTNEISVFISVTYFNWREHQQQPKKQYDNVLSLFASLVFFSCLWPSPSNWPDKQEAREWWTNGREKSSHRGSRATTKIRQLGQSREIGEGPWLLRR